jgi:DNA-directed RNA polymerase subunit H (RpoH/RPB5)
MFMLILYYIMTSQNSSALISTVYTSRNTILDLMGKQGYNIEDYANFSVNEVNSMKQNNQLDMLLEKKEENPVTKRKNKIYIRYYLGKTIRPSNLQEMIDDLFNLEEILKKDDTLFIIIKDEINETLTNELKHIWESDGIFIVIENIKRLQFNILDHELVPKHTIVSESEVVNVMKKYNITDKIQFPDISRFDPVARAIGLRPGQLCHIVRPSKTAIEADYYRICI